MLNHALAKQSPRRLSMRVLAIAILSSCAALPAMAGVVSSPFGSPVIRTRVVHRRDIVGGTATSLPEVVQTPAPILRVQQQLESVSAAQSSGAEVVTLDWRRHGTYTIPIRVGMFSTLVMPKSSPVVQVAFTNPAALQVSVNAPTNVIMVRLMQPISVPGTIVTGDHTYFITVTPSDALWYQGVYWRDAPSHGAAETMDGIYTNPSAASQLSGQSARPTELEASLGGQPNFDYRIHGDADFRPLAVWDNGRFTWIQFKKNVQELPAVFVKDRNGLNIVNYTVHDAGTEIMVNRLMPEFVLRVGRQDVVVKAGGR